MFAAVLGNNEAALRLARNWHLSQLDHHAVEARGGAQITKITAYLSNTCIRHEAHLADVRSSMGHVGGVRGAGKDGKGRKEVWNGRGE